MAHASRRGKFVTLEGVDGAGKSSLLSWIAERLRASKGAPREVLVSREPGGTPLAERLRSLVLDEAMDPFCETLLMFAARADHVRNAILPALERGAWVLCDRFSDATFAYQGGGKGVPRDLIEFLAAGAHPGLAPDLTLVFDCPYEVSRARLAGTGRLLDRFESQEREFFERVRTTYREISSAEPWRVRIVDASGPLDIVKLSVDKIISTI